MKHKFDLDLDNLTFIVCFFLVICTAGTVAGIVQGIIELVKFIAGLM